MRTVIGLVVVLALALPVKGLVELLTGDLAWTESIVFGVVWGFGGAALWDWLSG